MIEPTVKVDVLFGHIAVESRLRPEGNRIVGEGRVRHYDRYGKLTEDSGWEPTGIVLTLPEPESRRWWDFWK